MVNANDVKSTRSGPLGRCGSAGCEAGTAGALLLRKEHRASYPNKVTRQKSPTMRGTHSMLPTAMCLSCRRASETRVLHRPACSSPQHEPADPHRNAATGLTTDMLHILKYFAVDAIAIKLRNIDINGKPS